MNVYYNNEFPGLENSPELLDELTEKIPCDMEDVKVVHVQGTPDKWMGIYTCKVKDENSLETFLKAYQAKTGEVLRCREKRVCGERSPYLINNTYRCHCDTGHGPTRDSLAAKRKSLKYTKKRFKNTYCKFKMFVQVARDAGELPCKVTIEYGNHNHPIHSLEATGFRPLGDDAIIKVNALFVKGLSPALAYYQYMTDLASSCSSELEFHRRKADRSLCPRRRDFNCLFRKFCEEMFGGKNGEEMFSELESNLERMGREQVRVKWQMYDDVEETPLVIAIVTPLMERIHTMIHQSGELVFIDSTSSLEEHNLRFFLLVTHSVAGALPLGIIIASDEKEGTIIQGLTMLTEILPTNAFYGRGGEGPQVFMTDNCKELRQALRYTWPNAVLLLCIFHLLQQVWRWLFERDHGIAETDRQSVMVTIKGLLYCESEDALLVLIDEMDSNESIQKYPGLVMYLSDLMERKEEWAVCYRKVLLIRGSNTNNYVEAQFLVLKDTILARTRQFNVNALLSKLFEEFEQHFKVRLASLADGSYDGFYSRRFCGRRGIKGSSNGFCIPSDNITDQVVARVTKVGENLFSVPSKTTQHKTYIVDMSLGRCECMVGSDGSPCFHQYALWSRQIANCSNFLPVFSSKERQHYAKVAFGTSLHESYYESLHSVVSVDFDEPIIDRMPRHIDGITTGLESRPVNQSPAFGANLQQEEAINALDEAYAELKQLIQLKDPDMNRGIIQFSKRVKRLKPTQQISALHVYGGAFLCRTKRGKIHTQPTASKRRKSVNGSRGKQDTRGDNPKRRLTKLPNRAISKSRCHCLAANVRENVPNAKKGGSSKMKSVSKVFCEKLKKKD